jgi:predicted transcriptional regulator
MNDRIMDAEILQALNIQRDYAMSTRLVGSTLTAIAGRPVDLDAVQRRLTWLRDRGFLVVRVDDYGDEQWIITEKGINHLQAAR